MKIHEMQSRSPGVEASTEAGTHENQSNTMKTNDNQSTTKRIAEIL